MLSIEEYLTTSLRSGRFGWQTFQEGVPPVHFNAKDAKARKGRKEAVGRHHFRRLSIPFASFAFFASFASKMLEATSSAEHQF
jgi:hypothetical protein